MVTKNGLRKGLGVFQISLVHVSDEVDEGRRNGHTRD